MDLRENSKTGLMESESEVIRLTYNTFLFGDQ